MAVAQLKPLHQLIASHELIAHQANSPLTRVLADDDALAGRQSEDHRPLLPREGIESVFLRRVRRPTVVIEQHYRAGHQPIPKELNGRDLRYDDVHINREIGDAPIFRERRQRLRYRSTYQPAARPWREVGGGPIETLLIAFPVVSAADPIALGDAHLFIGDAAKCIEQPEILVERVKIEPIANRHRKHARVDPTFHEVAGKPRRLGCRPKSDMDNPSIVVDMARLLVSAVPAASVGALKAGIGHEVGSLTERAQTDPVVAVFPQHGRLTSGIYDLTFIVLQRDGTWKCIRINCHGNLPFATIRTLGRDVARYRGGVNAGLNETPRRMTLLRSDRRNGLVPFQISHESLRPRARCAVVTDFNIQVIAELTRSDSTNVVDNIVQARIERPGCMVA